MLSLFLKPPAATHILKPESDFSFLFILYIILGIVFIAVIVTIIILIVYFKFIIPKKRMVKTDTTEITNERTEKKETDILDNSRKLDTKVIVIKDEVSEKMNKQNFKLKNLSDDLNEESDKQSE